MQDRPPVTLLGALRHRRLLIGAVIGAFLLAGGLLSLRPKVYEASAAIYIDAARGASSVDAGLATGDLIQHDFIVMATTRPVLSQACATPDVSCSPAEVAAPETVLAPRISVNVFRGTSMLTVGAKAPNPADAAALANAVAQAMIDHDKAEIVRLMKPTLDGLQKQLTQISTAIAGEEQALQHSPAASSTAAAHQAELTRLQAQYAATFVRQQDALQMQDHLTSVATIVQPATPPTRPAAPDPPRYLLAALVAGVVVAVLIALLLERLDDRIYDADGLARAAGIPLALTAGRSRRWLPSREQSPYALTLARVLAKAPDARSILVTAASARDSSDQVASSLGIAAEQAGHRVVLVRGDGLSKNGHSKNGHSKNGHLPIDGSVGWLPRVEGEVPRTLIMPSHNGTRTASAVADLCRDGAEPATPLVVVAAPSPDQSATALLLAGSTRCTILAATAGRTRIGEVQRTAELLREAGIAVLGGILVSGRAPAPA